MSSRRKAFNPFYALLVVVGVLFTVTACAYGVMTVRDLRATTLPPEDAPGEALMEQVRQHGFMALMVELGALAVATVGAMATDEYWERRAARDRQQDSNRERQAAAARDAAPEPTPASEPQVAQTRTPATEREAPRTNGDPGASA